MMRSATAPVRASIGQLILLIRIKLGHCSSQTRPLRLEKQAITTPPVLSYTDNTGQLLPWVNCCKIC
jgi:hypothetical protein